MTAPSSGGGPGDRAPAPGSPGPAALHDSAGVLRLLAENATDVLFRIQVDPPMAFEYVSPSVEAMTGYAPEEFYRDPALGRRIVHPDDRQRTAELLSATEDGVVVRWVHRDGTVRHVEPRAIAVRSPSGRPVAVEGIVRDVTARVQAAEALRESEARVRSVFAAMAEGVLIFDAGRRVVDCNRSAERILGMTREELLGRASDRDLHAVREDGTPFPPAEYPVNRTFRTGQPTRDVLTGVPRADGSLLWISASSEPLRRSGEERLHGVLLSCADVTEERRAWVEVRRREAQLRLAMECAGHEFWDIEVSTGFLTRGGSIGVPPPSRPDDVRAWWDQVHPDDVERTRAALESHLAGRTPAAVFECRVRGPDGGWRWILHSARAVTRDERGRATRVAGTITDVTETKRLRDQLRDAERLAAVGTLAAGVAHEVNNPLAYVLSSVALAGESLTRLESARAAAAPLAEVRQALRDAMDGVERVQGIVRGLRQFAQPGRGEERGPVDLRTEIEAAVRIARNEIAHRARLEVDVPERLPAVRASSHELGQVLVNLLVNAAHAIPEGHAQDHVVRVSARAEGGRVQIRVSDTGAGIDAADLPRVFDPFFTTRPGAGVGLGLSVCHGIVTTLGGTIDVESAPGRGSTFRVVLPVEVEPSAPPTPVLAPGQPHPAGPVDLAGGTSVPDGYASGASAPPDPLLAPGQPHPAGPALARVPGPAPARRGRVLVLDDEALVAKSLGRLLAAHEVTVLTSAAEALARVAAGERWDVILCDLMMPEMDGMEVERRLATQAPDLVPRIVYMTGGAFTDRSRAFLASGRPHLDKPITPAVLRAKVAERLAALAGS